MGHIFDGNGYTYCNKRANELKDLEESCESCKTSYDFLHTKIGHLISLNDKLSVIGLCCLKEKTAGTLCSPIYKVNIFSYRQTCVHCSKELMPESSLLMSELYHTI